MQSGASHSSSGKVHVGDDQHSETAPLAQSEVIQAIPVVQGQVVSSVNYGSSDASFVGDQRQGLLIIVQNEGIGVPVAEVPPYPIQVTCPHCSTTVITRVVIQPGVGTYVLSAILCCIFCPFSFLPCVFRETQDCLHVCPNCGKEIVMRRFC